MDKNGLVTVVADKGSVAGRAAIQEILTPTASPSPWSFSQLVSGIMGMLASACAVVITNSRKVFFSDHDDGVTHFNDEMVSSSDCVRFTPTAGQTGRSLVWGATIGDAGELTTGQMNSDKALAAALIDPVPQKKTAEKLAEDLLSLVDSNNNPVFKTVLVDQEQKWIVAKRYDYATSLETGLPTTGNTGVVEVDGDPDPSDPTVPKLPFEGGEI